MLKTCLSCGTRYAWSLTQCPHDGATDYLESGETITATDAVSTAASGTLTVGRAAQVDCTAANATRTVPAAATAGAGKRLIVRKVDSTVHTLTVQPTGGDTVGGAASYVLDAAGEGVELASDGVSDWLLVQVTAPNPLLVSIYLTRSEAGSAGAAMAVVLDT